MSILDKLDRKFVGEKEVLKGGALTCYFWTF